MQATIFGGTADRLALLLKEAALDHAAFEKPRSLCDLGQCRATCCHDGVILSEEEAAILGREGDGIECQADGRFRTKRVAAHPHERADAYPAHFPKTRCVFLDEHHRCQWQVRATREGRPDWYYKPISCWMHPLILKTDTERPVLTVLSPDQDKNRFASFTPCGRIDPEGLPGRHTFRKELLMLGEISGRDFYRELNAPPGFSEVTLFYP